MVEIDYLLRLGLTLFLAAIIGLEREREDKPAGLRTTIFVSLGACLAAILSLELVKIFNQLEGQNLRFNFARIAAYTIAGIGFLGGGIIMKKEKRLEGITTAAVLWLLVINSLLIGYGSYLLGTIVGLSTFLILKLKYVEIKLKKRGQI